MKVSSHIVALTCLLQSCNALDGALPTTRKLKVKKAKGGKKAKKNGGNGSNSGVTIPEIGSLINIAFPMWEVDGNGTRVVDSPCTVNSCEWNPYYLTKRYDGLHPRFGGHPTDLDVKYAFFGASPFGGQPYPGTPHHCKAGDDDSIKAKDCPKLETLTDTGPYGPGHVPPHIALAALTWYVDKLGSAQYFKLSLVKFNPILYKFLLTINHPSLIYFKSLFRTTWQGCQRKSVPIGRTICFRITRMPCYS